MSRGKFITIEGGEGAGKSTQVAALVAQLQATGIDVLSTREPGGSDAGAQIRRLLLEGPVDRWDPVSELLLHSAARREHLVETIWPALESGRWVVSDRFADSTMAYQGYGHELGREAVQAVTRLAVGDTAPDLTVILDLPPEMGLARARARGRADKSAEDRYERMGADFHERLRAGFLDIARREPERCVVIDAAGQPEAVGEAIWRAAAERLNLG